MTVYSDRDIPFLLWCIFLFIPAKKTYTEVMRDNMRMLRIDKFKTFGVCQYWISTEYTYCGTSMTRLTDTYRNKGFK